MATRDYTVGGAEITPHPRTLTDLSDDELISDVQNVASSLGADKLSYRKYDELGKFSASTVMTRFGSWQAAMSKAGLSAAKPRNLGKEELFKNLVEVWTSLGKQPKTRDLNANVSRFSWSTYSSKFGSWRNALEEFVEWANSGDIEYVGKKEKSSENTVRRTPRNVNWRLRARVLMRDGAVCRLCGASPQTGAKLHVDHIYPWSKGGETTEDNLQILCKECNLGKSDMLP